MIYAFYITSLAISAIVAALLAFFFWQKRPKSEATSAVWLMLATVIISVGYILQYTNTTLSGQIFATNIQYAGIVSLPVTWLTFSLRYTNRDKWLDARNLFLFSVIPIITFVLAWTNGIDGMMWHNRYLETSGPFVIIAKTYGPWFWIHISYSYLLYFAGTFLLFQRLFRPPGLYRQQSIALLICVGAPLAWNVVYIFNLIPIYRIDLIPSAFTISGLAIAWGLFRLRLLDIIPIARDTVIESMSEGVIVLDTENRLVDINPAAQHIIGCSLSDVIGQPITTVLPQQSELVERSHTLKVEAYLNIVIEQDATQHYYESSISPLQDRHGHLIGRLVTLRDITERRLIEAKSKDLEEKAHLASRLSIVGEMAAGIAHEVNNPLTAVLGYSDLLLKQDISDKIRDDLEIINRGAKRAADILSRLLKFAGQQGLELEYIDINHITEAVVEFRGNSLANNKIDVILNLTSKLPKTLADGNQLQEVFLNLIINAENSIVQAHRGEGGTLTITTETNGDSIYISFTDNGIGINQENLNRIFYPFFTIMGSGKGTGLGLSISQRIMNMHGGEITAESQPGSGATFIIKLPIAEANKEAWQTFLNQ
ncbi:histidine kinase N-terminal 7TM domain-containing protein [Chloroflexota bacterium]